MCASQASNRKKEAEKKDRKQASENGLTSVHAEVAVVLVQGLQGGDVRGPFHDVVHPLDGAHHLVALRLGEDRGTFVFGDLGYGRGGRGSRETLREEHGEDLTVFKCGLH